MKKILLASLIYLLSFSCFALSMGNVHNVKPVPQACATEDNTSDPQFCAKFQDVARCDCSEDAGFSCSPLSGDEIHTLMHDMEGSQDAACRHQSHTSYQTCMNDWNFYCNSCAHGCSTN